MKINIFYPKGLISIKRSFEPLIRALRELNDVYEYELPYSGGNPVYMWKNIWYVRKHRLQAGINHIAGDAHYCVLGLIGVPSVLTIHDDYAMRQAHRGPLDKIHKWVMWLKLPIFFSKEVVCISPQTYANIKRYVRTSKMRIIAHHCMNEDFKFSEKTFNSVCPTILQIGTLPHKNLETTLKAIEKLDCVLHVIQPMTMEQKQLAEKLRIPYINLFNLTNEEVIEEYKKADIVVFPSDYEGFGMPIVEAQATGRLVITTNKQPMCWVSGNNGAIFVDDPKNPVELRAAILEAINNSEKRKKCIKNGLKNVCRFSLTNVYRDYNNVYMEAFKA